jgi:hypothetical protein
MEDSFVLFSVKTPFLTRECKYKLKPIKNPNLFEIGIKII